MPQRSVSTLGLGMREQSIGGMKVTVGTSTALEYRREQAVSIACRFCERSTPSDARRESEEIYGHRYVTAHGRGISRNLLARIGRLRRGGLGRSLPWPRDRLCRGFI